MPSNKDDQYNLKKTKVDNPDQVKSAVPNDYGDITFKRPPKHDKAAAAKEIAGHVVKNTAAGIWEGLGQALRYKFPAATAVVGDIGRLADHFNSVRTDFMKKAEPQLRDLRRSTARLMPRADRYLPPQLRGKLSEATKQWDVREPVKKNVSDEDRREAAIATELQNVIAKQTTTQKTYAEEDRTDKQVDRVLKGMRHEDTLKAFETIDARMKSIDSFNRGIHLEFLKKGLELKYKQLYTQKDTFNILKGMAQIMEVKLEEIKHNTGLSDFEKRQFVHEEWIKSDPVLQFRIKQTQWLAKFRQKTLDNMFSKVLEGARTAANTASSVADMSDMMDEVNEQSGEESDLSEGQKGIKNATGFFAKMGAAIGTNAVGRKMLSTLATDADDYDEMVGQMREQFSMRADKLRDDWNEAGGAKGFLSSFIPEWERGTKFKTEGVENLEAPSQFDTGTHRTVNEIIPGFLSRMLQTLEDLTYGGNHERLAYNQIKGKFSQVSDYKKDINKAVFGSPEQRLTNVEQSIGAAVSSVRKRGDVKTEKKLSEDVVKQGLGRVFLNMATNEVGIMPGAIHNYVTDPENVSGSDKRYIDRIIEDVDRPDDVLSALHDVLYVGEGEDMRLDNKALTHIRRYIIRQLTKDDFRKVVRDLVVGGQREFIPDLVDEEGNLMTGGVGKGFFQGAELDEERIQTTAKSYDRRDRRASEEREKLSEDLNKVLSKLHIDADVSDIAAGAAERARKTGKRMSGMGKGIYDWVSEQTAPEWAKKTKGLFDKSKSDPDEVDAAMERLRKQRAGELDPVDDIASISRVVPEDEADDRYGIRGPAEKPGRFDALNERLRSIVDKGKGSERYQKGEAKVKEAYGKAKDPETYKEGAAKGREVGEDVYLYAAVLKDQIDDKLVDARLASSYGVDNLKARRDRIKGIMEGRIPANMADLKQMSADWFGRGRKKEEKESGKLGTRLRNIPDNIRTMASNLQDRIDARIDQLDDKDKDKLHQLSIKRKHLQDVITGETSATVEELKVVGQQLGDQPKIRKAHDKISDFGGGMRDKFSHGDQIASDVEAQAQFLLEKIDEQLMSGDLESEENVRYQNVRRYFSRVLKGMEKASMEDLRRVAKRVGLMVEEEKEAPRPSEVGKTRGVMSSVRNRFRKDSDDQSEEAGSLSEKPSSTIEEFSERKHSDDARMISLLTSIDKNIGSMKGGFVGKAVGAAGSVLGGLAGVGAGVAKKGFGIAEAGIRGGAGMAMGVGKKLSGVGAAGMDKLGSGVSRLAGRKGKFSDVYLVTDLNRDTPLITAAMQRAGQVVNFDGKILRNTSDIHEPLYSLVTDKPLITVRDLSVGLVDGKGRNVYGSKTKKTARDSFRDKFTRKRQRRKARKRGRGQYFDVYVRGEIDPGNPVLSARMQRQGVYFEDGRKVGSTSEITVPVFGQNENGDPEAIITEEMIKKGLVSLSGDLVGKTKVTKKSGKLGMFAKTGNKALGAAMDVVKGYGKMLGFEGSVLKMGAKGIGGLVKRIFGNKKTRDDDPMLLQMQETHELLSAKLDKLDEALELYLGMNTVDARDNTYVDLQDYDDETDDRIRRLRGSHGSARNARPRGAAGQRLLPAVAGGDPNDEDYDGDDGGGGGFGIGDFLSGGIAVDYLKNKIFPKKVGKPSLKRKAARWLGRKGKAGVDATSKLAKKTASKVTRKVAPKVTGKIAPKLMKGVNTTWKVGSGVSKGVAGGALAALEFGLGAREGLKEDTGAFDKEREDWSLGRKIYENTLGIAGQTGRSVSQTYKRFVKTGQSKEDVLVKLSELALKYKRKLDSSGVPQELASDFGKVAISLIQYIDNNDGWFSKLEYEPLEAIDILYREIKQFAGHEDRYTRDSKRMMKHLTRLPHRERVQSFKRMGVAGKVVKLYDNLARDMDNEQTSFLFTRILSRLIPVRPYEKEKQKKKNQATGRSPKSSKALDSAVQKISPDEDIESSMPTQRHPEGESRDQRIKRDQRAAAKTVSDNLARSTPSTGSADKIQDDRERRRQNAELAEAIGATQNKQLQTLLNSMIGPLTKLVENTATMPELGDKFKEATEESARTVVAPIVSQGQQNQSRPTETILSRNNQRRGPNGFDSDDTF